MSNESVYNLIPAAPPAVSKPPRYHSKHNASAPPSCSTFGFHGTSKVLSNVAGEPADTSVHPAKKAFGTFGRTVNETVSPKQFLKRTTQPSHLSPPSGYAPAQFKYPDEVARPPVPKRDEKPVMGLKTDKNFVVANAVENILAVPKKKPEEAERAVNKATFGKVPAYIHRTKEELREHYKLVDAYGAAAAKAESDRLVELPAEELKELKAGLQRRWETLNKQFQTMGFNLETKTQIKHREQIELELRHLEQALAKVGKPHLYVYDDKK